MIAYTQEDDRQIIICLQKSPNNLRVAFEIASLKVGRTANAVSQRYYKVLRAQKTIAVASNTGIAVLGKNTPRKQVIPDATTVRDAMLNTAIQRLSKERAIKFLLDNLSDTAKSALLIRIAQRVSGL